MDIQSLGIRSDGCIFYAQNCQLISFFIIVLYVIGDENEKPEFLFQ